jgi:cell division protein FtsW
MLILVVIPKIGVEINGSRSWFKIGSFLLQPSEIFKIFIVIYMGDKLEKY